MVAAEKLCFIYILFFFNTAFYDFINVGLLSEKMHCVEELKKKKKKRSKGLQNCILGRLNYTQTHTHT